MFKLSQLFKIYTELSKTRHREWVKLQKAEGLSSALRSLFKSVSRFEHLNNAPRVYENSVVNSILIILPKVIREVSQEPINLNYILLNFFKHLIMIIFEEKRAL